MSAPDRTRGKLSLNGPWQIVFDKDDNGLARGWTSGQWPGAKAESVPVPAPWDVTHPAARGIGFYRRTFRLPNDWAGKSLLLHFAGASYRTEAWVNGQFAGSHEGAYTPFYFDVTALVRAGGEQELIVRVAGLSRDRPVDGQILVQAPASKQSWYYEYSGLWGEVSLETRPVVAIEMVQIEPDLRGESASVQVGLMNRCGAAQPVELQLRVTCPDGATALEQSERLVAPPGLARFAYRLPLPRPRPWHPDTPNLYHLETIVAPTNGEADEHITAFGMRDFSVHNGQFLLNGSPIYLQGVLLQPNYPVTLVAPPDREMMERELKLVKEAGFNLLRAHIRPAPPGYLDLADKLGLLVYAETSLAWIRHSSRLLDHGRREVQALIERDFNHPSVVFWGILNENRFAAAEVAEPLLRLARGLDPTRVVVDNSGGTMAVDQDYGWIDRASVIPNRETARERIIDLHLYLGDTLPGPLYEWLRGLGTGGASTVLAEQDFSAQALLPEFDRELRSYTGQIFVSELGCGGMADLDETLAGFGERTGVRDAEELRAFRDSLKDGFAARQLDRLFGDLHHLALAAQAQHAAGNTNQIEAVLANPRISGYCITQLNDVSWEFHAGLLDLWRNPKPAYFASQRLNRPQVLILHSAAPVATTGAALHLRLTQVNRAPLAGQASIELSLVGPAGQTTKLERRQSAVMAGIQELGEVVTEPVSVAGQYAVRARLMAGHEMLDETQQSILVLAPADELDGQVTRQTWLGEQPAWLAQQTGRPAASDHADALLMVPRPGSLRETEWDTLLERVQAGRTAILGALHKRDTVALGSLTRHGRPVEVHLGIGNWMGCYHWAPVSELFAGLPAGGLAGPAYVDVLPWYVLTELGGQVLAGSFRNSMTRVEAPRALWYGDVEVVPHGAGEIIFCQYRIFEQAGAHPLAARLTSNLMRLGARRQPGRAGVKKEAISHA